jgi:Homeodomain-like domain
VTTLVRFTVNRRGEVLAALRAGASLEQACAAVGVSVRTVQRWAAAGRVPGAAEDVRVFAEGLAAVRAEHVVNGNGNGHGPLGDDEAEQLLVSAARAGRVSALTELRRRQPPPNEPPDPLAGASREWRSLLEHADGFSALDLVTEGRVSPEPTEREQRIAWQVLHALDAATNCTVAERQEAACRALVGACEREGVRLPEGYPLGI